MIARQMPVPMLTALTAFTVLAALAGPVRAGEPMELTFPANPSTGYHWALNAESSTGAEFATVEDLGYGPPDSALIGAPAPVRFRVSCAGVGAVRLVFDYVSPDGSTVAETRAVELACD